MCVLGGRGSIVDDLGGSQHAWCVIHCRRGVIAYAVHPVGEIFGYLWFKDFVNCDATRMMRRRRIIEPARVAGDVPSPSIGTHSAAVASWVPCSTGSTFSSVVVPK